MKILKFIFTLPHKVETRLVPLHAFIWSIPLSIIILYLILK